MSAPVPQPLWSALSPDPQQVLERSHAKRQIQLADSPHLRPMMLIVETINICNSECVFCPYTIQTRPKGVMPQPLFERVVAQYLALGGGALSLTPRVGDALGRWDDDAVRRMLTGLDRIHVSIYGITPEENREITRKNLHGALCTQVPRLLALAAELPHAVEIAVGFRTLHDYSPADLENFQRTTFDRVIAAVSATATYANWGGSMRAPPARTRPLDGRARELHGLPAPRSRAPSLSGRPRVRLRLLRLRRQRAADAGQHPGTDPRGAFQRSRQRRPVARPRQQPAPADLSPLHVPFAVGRPPPGSPRPLEHHRVHRRMKLAP